jgi:hypothetical protein
MYFLVFKRGICVDITYLYYDAVFFMSGIFMVLHPWIVSYSTCRTILFTNFIEQSF